MSVVPHGTKTERGKRADYQSEIKLVIICTPNLNTKHTVYIYYGRYGSVVKPLYIISFFKYMHN